MNFADICELCSHGVFVDSVNCADIVIFWGQCELFRHSVFIDSVNCADIVVL